MLLPDACHPAPECFLLTIRHVAVVHTDSEASHAVCNWLSNLGRKCAKMRALPWRMYIFFIISFQANIIEEII